MVKKHVSYRYDKKGTIIEKEMPIHVSNVKRVEKETKKADKVEKKEPKKEVKKPADKKTADKTKKA